MADEYTIRRGDHGVQIRGILRDADGVAVPITGATLVFNMGPAGGGTAVLEAEATNEEEGAGETGEWSYTWQQEDTEDLDPGVYLAEVRSTFETPALQTYPNGGYILVRVTREVAPTPEAP
jgi:hypothetical protein